MLIRSSYFKLYWFLNSLLILPNLLWSAAAESPTELTKRSIKIRTSASSYHGKIYSELFRAIADGNAPAVTSAIASLNSHPTTKSNRELSQKVNKCDPAGRYALFYLPALPASGTTAKARAELRRAQQAHLQIITALFAAGYHRDIDDHGRSLVAHVLDNYAPHPKFAQTAVRTLLDHGCGLNGELTTNPIVRAAIAELKIAKQSAESKSPDGASARRSPDYE